MTSVPPFFEKLNLFGVPLFTGNKSIVHSEKVLLLKNTESCRLLGFKTLMSPEKFTSRL